MAGCSLTLMWLDGELEQLWTAPADTPAYRKGGVVTSAEGELRTAADSPAAAYATAAGEPTDDDEAGVVAENVLTALEAMAATVAGVEEELGRIDAVAGDGDHGRGISGVLQPVPELSSRSMLPRRRKTGVQRLTLPQAQRGS
jgi:hypothetical protein